MKGGSLLQKKYQKEVVPAMRKKFGYANDQATPSIRKAVVNTGTGRFRDPRQAEEVARYLGLITGQKTAERKTRQSIASFKTRIGMVVGYATTLRGKRMYDFLERLVSAAIPRTRDFRGIPLSAIDMSGNLTIGIKEHIIFPEMTNEDIHTLFGLQITIVTNARSRDEGKELLTLLGFPLQKE